jgi:EAL domain-containing protein (putative c-di-GMP-specific phosphodiesterase class I)
MGQDLARLLERVIAHYQPIVDLGTGGVVGFEMLARIAEDAGPARSIGPLIEGIEGDPDHLERLMQQLLAAIQRDVQPLFARYPDFYVSVNVPPAMLGDGKIRAMIADLGLTPCLNRLVCEVTERQALTDAGRAALDTARKLHVRIAMDDFGTGNSGLAQLLGQTFDVLKIDRSQVEHLLKDPTADRLVRGIVALASVLRARTVRKGLRPPRRRFSFMPRALIAAKVGSGARRCPPRSCRGSSKADSGTGDARCLRCCMARRRGTDYPSGFSQRRPLKRAKSVSHETSTASWLRASAARCASVVRFPAVPALPRSGFSIFQWSSFSRTIRTFSSASHASSFAVARLEARGRGNTRGLVASRRNPSSTTQASPMVSSSFTAFSHQPRTRSCCAASEFTA